MSAFDIVLAIPLLWGLYKGFNKGLILEIISILSFIIGIYLAIHFSYVVADFIGGKKSSQYIQLVAFAITFIGTLVLMFWIGKLLDNFAKKIQLGTINKIGGAAFGTIKVALIIGVMLSYLEKIDSVVDIVPESKKTESLLYKPVQKVSETIIPKLSIEKFKKLNPVAEKESVKDSK